MPFRVPLYHVDPHKKHGLLYRANVWFGRSRLGRAYGLRLGSVVDALLFRASGGRYPGRIGSIATAPLVTTGARSGQPRQVQLTYFHDGTDPILIASNGGGAKHPAWVFNLRAQPECEFGDKEFHATEVTDAAEYARLYALAELVYAHYADYRITTAAIGRHIPMFRLTPSQS